MQAYGVEVSSIEHLHIPWPTAMAVAAAAAKTSAFYNVANYLCRHFFCYQMEGRKRLTPKTGDALSTVLQ